MEDKRLLKRKAVKHSYAQWSQQRSVTTFIVIYSYMY